MPPTVVAVGAVASSPVRVDWAAWAVLAYCLGLPAAAFLIGWLKYR